MSPIPFNCLELHEKSPVFTYSQGIQSTAKEENCWDSPEAHFLSNAVVNYRGSNVLQSRNHNHGSTEHWDISFLLRFSQHQRLGEI